MSTWFIDEADERLWQRVRKSVYEAIDPHLSGRALHLTELMLFEAYRKCRQRDRGEGLLPNPLVAGGAPLDSAAWTGRHGA